MVHAPCSFVLPAPLSPSTPRYASPLQDTDNHLVWLRVVKCRPFRDLRRFGVNRREWVGPSVVNGCECPVNRMPVNGPPARKRGVWMGKVAVHHLYKYLSISASSSFFARQYKQALVSRPLFITFLDLRSICPPFLEESTVRSFVCALLKNCYILGQIILTILQEKPNVDRLSRLLHRIPISQICFLIRPSWR